MTRRRSPESDPPDEEHALNASVVPVQAPGVVLVATKLHAPVRAADLQFADASSG